MLPFGVIKFLQHTTLHGKAKSDIARSVVSALPRAITVSKTGIPGTSLLAVFSHSVAFLTGSDPQTEIAVSYSKQKAARFLTGSRIAVRDIVFRTSKCDPASTNSADKFKPIP